MRTHSSLFLLLLPIFFLCSISSSTSSSVDPTLLRNFFNCLPEHSDHSNPISRFTYTPSNSSFLPTLQARIKNRRFLTSATPKPVAIIVANHESHVQATITCAKSWGLQIRIRSGGHDFEGLSYTSQVPFLLLDMFHFRSIDVDIVSETAWVQSGATLGELYYAIARKSNVHAFPAGVCPTVGVGGHFSGGGFGNLMRKYGLAVDNVVDAVFVDVDAKILNRSLMGEDLFWAIRGGGGASFGVVLSWKIKLVRIPDNVTVFRVDRYLDQGATDIVYRWQEVALTSDKDLFIRTMPQVVEGRGKGNLTIKVSFFGFFLGQVNSLVPLMRNTFSELGLSASDCHELSWIQSAVFWANFPIGTPPEALLSRSTGALPLYFKKKSDFVRNLISKTGLESIWKMMINVGKFWMQWNPYGGIMDEISDTETPVPHRSGYLFMIEYSTQWNDDRIDAERQINLMRRFFDGMAPLVTENPREAFLNYRDLDIGSNPSNQTNLEKAKGYGIRYFKQNFNRLAGVKGKVDPDNFFRNEQSIPPMSLRGTPDSY